MFLIWELLHPFLPLWQLSTCFGDYTLLLHDYLYNWNPLYSVSLVPIYTLFLIAYSEAKKHSFLILCLFTLLFLALTHQSSTTWCYPQPQDSQKFLEWFHKLQSPSNLNCILSLDTLYSKFKVYQFFQKYICL